MKELYEQLEMETVVFVAKDVITESPFDDDPNHENGGDEHNI